MPCLLSARSLGPDDIEAEHAIAAVVATGCLAPTCYDLQEQLVLVDAVWHGLSRMFSFLQQDVANYVYSKADKW